MKDTIDFPVRTLHNLFSEYISLRSDEIARMILDGLFVDAVDMNSDRDNNGALVRLMIEIPSSEECRKILETDDIMSIRCPGI